MINRSHLSMPSATIIQPNPQASKAPGGNSFGVLLNALNGSRQEMPPGLSPEQVPVPEPRFLADEKQPSECLENSTDASQLINSSSTSSAMEQVSTYGHLSQQLPTSMPVYANLQATELLIGYPDILPGYVSLETYSQISEDAVVPGEAVPVADAGNNVMDIMQLTNFGQVISHNPLETGDASHVVLVHEAAQSRGNVSPEVFEANHTTTTQVIDAAQMHRHLHAEVERTIPGSMIQNADDVHVHRYVATQATLLEVVSVPWRLQANAGMSYQSSHSKNQYQSIPSHKTDISLSVKSLNENAAIKSQMSTIGAAAVYEAGFIQSPLISLASEIATVLSNVYETARAEKTNTRAAMITWPHRALHWLADGENTTAWVRDYQLDTNGIKSLIGALRCVAEQQGFNLHRIMLNGHEAWRAPSTT